MLTTGSNLYKNSCTKLKSVIIEIYTYLIQQLHESTANLVRSYIITFVNKYYKYFLV